MRTTVPVLTTLLISTMIGTPAYGSTAFGDGSGLPTTTLHPGDKISLNILNHPELQVPTATIDGSGRVSVPLIGLVGAANQTPLELDRTIARKLATYVRKPAVDVQLISQAPNVFVTGGPGGVYPYAPGETLVAVLSEIRSGSPTINTGVAGGGAVADATGVGTVAAPTASSPLVSSSRNFAFGSVDLTRVGILRDGRQLPTTNAKQLIASGEAGPRLQPGDTIEFADNPIAVAVSGTVAEPGVAHLAAGQPLSDALLQTGGTNGVDSMIGFVLTRDGKDQVVTPSDPAYRQAAQIGDRIYVPHAARVAVLGMVTKPGEVLLRGDARLLNALYFADGPNRWGDLKHVQVLRNGVQTTYDFTRLQHGATDVNPPLEDGDTVYVPEGHKIDFQEVFGAISAISGLRYFINP